MVLVKERRGERREELREEIRRRDEKKRGVEWRVERKRDNRNEGSSGCMRCKGGCK